jgi:hypothetical protein
MRAECVLYLQCFCVSQLIGTGSGGCSGSTSTKPLPLRANSSTLQSSLITLQVLANTKQTWLLILDNADDPNFDYQVYFPSGTHGAVLMTSRVAECKRYSLDAFEALEGLEDEDSKELLL